jgi:hypothetical protein
VTFSGGLFSRFNFEDFKSAQAAILVKLAKENGFNEDGIVGLEDLAMPDPISEGSSKYKLGNLIYAVGGSNGSGLVLEANVGHDTIEAKEAQDFIAQVDQRKK